MDPRHRDRVAFLRICCGRYSRDMEVWHSRMKRKVRLAPPLRLFGQEREVIEEAYAGDVIGVINPGLFAIGDTVSERDLGTFPPLPRFQPEHFALLRASRSDKYKQFLKGLTPDRGRGCDPALLPGRERSPGTDSGGCRRAPVRRRALPAGVGVHRRNSARAAFLQCRSLGLGRPASDRDGEQQPGSAPC